MPIIFHDDVKKGSKEDARRLLRMFLDEKEPQLVRWLHHTWNAQGRAITYKTLREWILAGDIDPELIEEWQQDYSRFIVKYLQPLYEAAMVTAAKVIEDKHALYRFDPNTESIKNWTNNTSAAFVTNSTNEQIQAVRTLVARAAQMQDISVDQLARQIRATVGLNKQQAMANQNYYKKMLEKGLSEQKALENAIKYSAQQHRYRGHMIARTELAFAYNKGEHEGVQQAIDKGYMGEVAKQWVDAGDDRVCDRCRSLNNRTKRNPIPMEQGFNIQTRLNYPGIDLCPPAHPHCRCVVVYRELKAPTFTTA